MSNLAALALFKILGFGIAAIATIWGLTRQTTQEDEHGLRRLTPAGQVAIALAVGSLLVAIGSFGFEMLLKQADAENARREKRDELARTTRERELREARENREAQRRQLDSLELRREAAEIRASTAEQRLLILATGGAQRQRDMIIMRDVNRGSVANLEKAAAVLEQLNRMARPLNNVRFTVMWKLPGIYYPSLAAYGRRVRHNPSLLRGVTIIESKDHERLMPFFPYGPKAEPFGDADPALQSLLGKTWSRLSFFAPGRDIEADIPDLTVVTSNFTPAFGFPYYNLDSEAIWFSTYQESKVTITGRITSVPDLCRATVVLQVVESPNQVLTIFAMETPDERKARVGREEDVRKKHRELSMLVTPFEVQVDISGQTFFIHGSYQRLARPGKMPTFVAYPPSNLPKDDPVCWRI